VAGQAWEAQHSELAELQSSLYMACLLGYDHEATASDAPHRGAFSLRGLHQASSSACIASATVHPSVFSCSRAEVCTWAIEAAFSALMRLSLRLVAERSNRPDVGRLDDPYAHAGAAAARPGHGERNRPLAHLRRPAPALTSVSISVLSFVVVASCCLPLARSWMRPERI
jgi:hypothetical protein